MGKGKIRENSGLRRGFTNELTKILKEVVAEKDEYPGELLPCEQENQLIQKDSVRFQAGKGKIRENSRLHKGDTFPARKSLVTDIPAGSRERTFLQCMKENVELDSGFSSI